MSALFRICPVLLALMLAHACVSTGNRQITDPGHMAKLETGKSTRTEVSALLGLPALVTYGDQGQETWEYYYVTEYPQATEFIPIVDALVPGFSQTTRVLAVNFDRQGVVRDLQRRQATGSPEKFPY